MTGKPDLTLYNTLTRQKEPFRPIDANNVRMYVCGPTVYDFAHIGNARPAIVFDVLYRLLRHVYGADHVTYVRNITDVDDKINARALRDHPDLPLNEAIRAVTETTLTQYLEDVTALGCLEPTRQPRATEHIGGMIAMIQNLIANGNAYVATGGEGREVLFDVTSMPDYGGLSRRKLDEQQAGARIAVEAHKKNPADFVLWKKSSATEPGWDAEFDGTPIHGRPGWHIECSVMSEHHLGKVFDIHGGGLDLIFPHHENEIAQSRCAHGEDRMANVWMHNGFLQVEGSKMSKSEGNFFTIHELMHTENFGGRKWPGEVLRLAMLMTHYREPIDFSVRRLEEAEHTLAGFSTAIIDTLGDTVGDLEASPNPSEGLIQSLREDLAFSEAVAHMRRLAEDARSNPRSAAQLLFDCEFLGIARRRFVGLLSAEFAGDPIDPGKMVMAFEPYQRYRIERLNGGEAALAELRTGLQRHDIGVAELSHGEIRIFDLGSEESDVAKEIDRRLAFIRDKNWAEADRIRDELLAQGIQLKDGKDPETGERVTTWGSQAMSRELQLTIDHVSLSVSDMERAKRFYAAALSPIGLELVGEVSSARSGTVAYAGFGVGRKGQLWLAEDGPQTPAAHICFRAETRGDVRAFHEAALSAGGRDNGEPGVREVYHPAYYAAFVLDPEGHNIEAVCFEAEHGDD